MGCSIPRLFVSHRKRAEEDGFAGRANVRDLRISDTEPIDSPHRLYRDGEHFGLLINWVKRKHRPRSREDGQTEPCRSISFARRWVFRSVSGGSGLGKGLVGGDSREDMPYVRGENPSQQVEWPKAVARANALLSDIEKATEPNHAWTDPALLDRYMVVAKATAAAGGKKFKEFQLFLKKRPSGDSELPEALGAPATDDKWIYFTTRGENGKAGDSEMSADFHYGAGIAIVHSMYSPIDRKNEKLGGRMSDLIFLAWKKICQDHNVPVDRLKTYVVTDISNVDTKQMGIEAYAMSGINQVPLFDEAKEWTPDDERAKALIGSPNGIPGLYMLLDHFDELGRKTVASVKYWRVKPGTSNLLISLRDMEGEGK